MFLDLDSTQGEKFQLFSSTIDPATGETIYDDPKGDAWVTLRPMQPFFEERIGKRNRKVEHVFNPKTRSMERVSYYPELSPEEAIKEREDAWDYSIVNIEGFKDSKTGKEIKCTRENKIKLMKLPVFDRFIAWCLQIMADSGVKEKAESEKNS